MFTGMICTGIGMRLPVFRADSRMKTEYYQGKTLLPALERRERQRKRLYV